MLTIISGTNRPGNISIRVSNQLLEFSTAMEMDVQLLDLQKLPADFAFRNDVFGNPDPGFTAISNQYVRNADKFLFVVPEYNGSIPGICKTFIDAVWPEQFKGKKAALVGLSSGRAGNLRGLDHLTGVLNYLNVTVLPQRVNIIHVDGQLDDDGRIVQQKTLQQMQRLMEEFSGF